ncbi:hypothetical protein [Enterorhabdus sp. P55]|uniref:hypothetical protein n=1 Tax=Enterorhabdus sp. P55 TaxID=2304571 RepID=UPI001370C67C|nr:hypothetical protein [Enterorhabdus sp. P55]
MDIYFEIPRLSSGFAGRKRELGKRRKRDLGKRLRHNQTWPNEARNFEADGHFRGIRAHAEGGRGGEARAR